MWGGMGEDVTSVCHIPCPKALPRSSGTCRGITLFAAGASYSLSPSRIGPSCLLGMTETQSELLGRQGESQL